MKITDVTIRNFRGIERLDLHVNEKIVAFLSENGKGKTSFLKAVKFALTGQADKADLMKGETLAVVSITFDDGTTIERQFDGTQKVRIDGKATTQKALAQFIEAKTGASQVGMSAMSGADFFSENEEIGRLLQKVLPLDITVNKILSLAETKGITGDGKTALEEALIIQADDAGCLDFTSIEKAYKAVYADRRNKKAVLKDEAARIIQVTPPTKGQQELEKDLAALYEEKAKASFYDKELAAYKAALIDAEVASKKKAELAAQISSFGTVLSLAEIEEGLKKAESEKAQFEEAIRKRIANKAVMNGNIERFKGLLEGIEKGTCPLSDRLICNTDKSALKSDTLFAIKANEDAIAENIAFTARCEEQVTMRDSRIRELQAEKEKAIRLTSLQAAMAAIVIPSVPVEPAKPAVDISEIDKQISEIGLQMEAIRQIQVQETLIKRVEGLKAEVAALEEAVAMLDPKKGIAMQILEGVLDSLTKVCHKKASTIGNGLSIKFGFDKGKVTVIAEKAGREIPIEELSSGEYILACYLLTGGVQALTGARQIYIDNLDRLDKESAKALLRLIEADPDIDNAFIAGVNHSDLVGEVKNLKGVFKVIL